MAGAADAPPGLAPLVGHGQIRDTLARAAHAGTLPSTLLFHGPEGVGKQRMALWLAQTLLCASATPQGPCGTCASCRLAVRLEHADLHWFFPLPRPKGASSPERLQAALEDARHAEIAQWRQEPVRPVDTTELTGIYVAAVRTLRALAAKRPATGPRQIFVIGRAERLVYGEAGQEAANALLKLLEEPPEGTTLILTSSEVEQVLPTIRSRAVPVHLPHLEASIVGDFLRAHTDADEDARERATALSGGSIGRALGYLPDGDDHGPLEQARRDAFAMIRAALTDPAGTYLHGSRQSPAGARTLMPLLDHLGVWIRDLAALQVGADHAVVNRDALDAARALLGPDVAAPALATCLDRVEQARVLAQGNVNPQLVVFGLLQEVRETLSAGATG